MPKKDLNRRDRGAGARLSAALPLRQVRSRLAALWFVGAAVSYMLLIMQSLGTVYRGRVQEAWGWALPALMPTLSLMVAVMGSYSLQGRAEEQDTTVRRDFYRLALGLSIVYLLLILGTILVQPFAVAFQPDERFQAADLLKLSSLWTAPLQSLVVMAIGALFFNKQVGTPGRT